MFTVGGRSELLKLAYDTAIGGDDEDIGMADRPSLRRLTAAPDLDALVAGYVELVVATGARVAGIYVALRAAADADERVRALHAEVQQQRLTGATGFVGMLAARGVLRPDLGQDAAADVLWTLLDPGSTRPSSRTGDGRRNASRPGGSGRCGCSCSLRRKAV